MQTFRFLNLDVWKKAVDVGNSLLDLADGLEEKRRFRFAEQLRGAALSISNNIAEGAGSNSDKEFAQFLNFAKRSAFENANMLLVFERRGLIASAETNALLEELDIECRMIESLRKSLLRN